MRLFLLGKDLPFAREMICGLPLWQHVRNLADLLEDAEDYALYLEADAAFLTEKALCKLPHPEVATHLGEVALALPMAQVREEYADAADVAEILAMLAAQGVELRSRMVEKEQVRRVETLPLLMEAAAQIRANINESLLRHGVRLLDPATTYVDAGVHIGAGTVVYPGCTLTGSTTIGEGCTLLPHCRLTDTAVGNGTTIENSVLVEAVVGDGTQVGPFAYLRPGSKIGNHCRVGDFVEVKNSTVGNDTKISHLTYVGDSDLGEGINLGCGVVFVNYDGKKKHRTMVEDDAFIGCNVNLVSPVHVGKGAYIAAGSTVTEDVPAGAFSIARSRQTTKEGWVEKRKEKGKL